jgi:predicted DsbA family dithiol-disulfide isomerase
MLFAKVFFLIIFVLFNSLSVSSQESKESSPIINTKKMKVEIWSDIVCPFCYIGKRHFENALKNFKYADEIEIVWKSYQLDPDISVQEPNKNVYQYLAERKGISYERSKGLHDNVVNMAKSVGLDYHFEKAIVANSFNAHRLIQFAKSKNLADAAEEALFFAYFTDGKDIGNQETLIEVGKKIGLDEPELSKTLLSDAFSEEVQKDIYEAHQVELGGVPHFVIDNRFAISGAQPVNIFLSALEKAYHTREK